MKIISNFYCKHKYFIFLFLIIVLIITFLNKGIERFIIKKNGIDNIDGCVYINLENRKDRKKLLVNEFEKMKIPKHKIHKVSGVYKPKNGYKGCTQSHILALRIGKMNNWDKTLVLEDDAELNCSPEEFQQKISKIFDYLNKKEWDVITLSKANEQLEDLEDKKYSDIKKVKGSTLATAYIVKNHYLDKLINLFEKGNKNMKDNIWRKEDGGQDHEPNVTDQIWGQLQKKDNWFGFNKDLIKQRAIYSDSLHNPDEKDLEEKLNESLI